MQASGRAARASLLGAAVLVVVTAAIIAALTAVGGPPAVRSALPNPLAPPDTASPRATMKSLTEELDAAEALMIATYKESLSEPGLRMSEKTAAQQDLIREHLNRAIRTLDLSQVPPASRAKTALETAMLLDEIIDRVGMPPLASIPDAAGMKGNSWTLPNSEIRIAKVTSGPNAGEFLFTPDTIGQAYDFYKRIRHIPPPDKFDFYAFYALSPGDLVPPKWYGTIQKLPNWFHTVIVDSARWQWIALGLTLFVALGFCVAVYRATRVDGALAQRMPASGEGLALPLAVLVAIWLTRAFVDELNFTGPVAVVLTTGFEVVLYLPMTWLAVVACNRLSDRVVEAWDLRGYDFDGGILRVVIRMVGVLLATAILAYGASQIGIPSVGILAGLGVGGIAIALAAQPTIENFIGGVMIYADRPVRVGDRCSFGDTNGVVEEIGIRSTRIRADDRSLISIPNSDFAKARLVNFSSRDKVLFNATLGLAYGVTEEQIRTILNRMRELMNGYAGLKSGKSEVHFSGFGSSALTIDISGEFDGGSGENLDAAREKLLLKLFNIVAGGGAQLVGR